MTMNNINDHDKEAQEAKHESEEQTQKTSYLQYTSSHSLSLSFGNQFLNSPNASLIGTIPSQIEAEVISLMDVTIQQEVPVVHQETLQPVSVTVIPESSHVPQPPPPPPPVTSIGKTTQVPDIEAVSSVV
ncbi:hypothetical protein Tco_1066766 [Tanacetum coccineum]|uniref:Uncharacterized protein n=1 Tax=Tanacetum coccineum TaxID=301880 RepID=A0ABQ5HC82_9ASTR